MLLLNWVGKQVHARGIGEGAVAPKVTVKLTLTGMHAEGHASRADHLKVKLMILGIPTLTSVCPSIHPTAIIALQGKVRMRPYHHPRPP